MYVRKLLYIVVGLMVNLDMEECIVRISTIVLEYSSTRVLSLVWEVLFTWYSSTRVLEYSSTRVLQYSSTRVLGYWQSNNNTSNKDIDNNGKRKQYRYRCMCVCLKMFCSLNHFCNWEKIEDKLYFSPPTYLANYGIRRIISYVFGKSSDGLNFGPALWVPQTPLKKQLYR